MSDLSRREIGNAPAPLGPRFRDVGTNGPWLFAEPVAGGLASEIASGRLAHADVSVRSQKSHGEPSTVRSTNA
jgi:hypothetical protein